MANLIWRSEQSILRDLGTPTLAGVVLLGIGGGFVTGWLPQARAPSAQLHSHCPSPIRPTHACLRIGDSPNLPARASNTAPARCGKHENDTSLACYTDGKPGSDIPRCVLRLHCSVGALEDARDSSVRNIKLRNNTEQPCVTLRMHTSLDCRYQRWFHDGGLEMAKRRGLVRAFSTV
jgi:hypothetical protein